MQYTIEARRSRLLGKKVIPPQRCMQVRLERGELFRLEGASHDQVLQVTEGRVWLTQSGNHKDIILEHGQAYRISGAELVLLEGLPSGIVCFLAGSNQ